MEKVFLHNMNAMIEQIEASFRHEVNLLSACGVCALLDILCQEHFLNFVVREELGIPYPNVVNPEEIRLALQYLDDIKNRKIDKATREIKFQGQGHIFKWSLQNFCFLFEGKPDRFTAADANALWKFRCTMIHNLGSEEYILECSRPSNNFEPIDANKFYPLEVVSQKGGKIQIYLYNLFTYCRKMFAKHIFASIGNVRRDSEGKPLEERWISLATYFPTNLELAEDE